MSSIASPTVSHAHTDVSEEVSKSEILKEVIIETLESRKPAVTIVSPAANSYAVSYVFICSYAESTTPYYTYSGEEQPNGKTFQDWLVARTV